MELSNTELILMRITGEDRPGLTASVTEILAKYDAAILDIGQADIHNTLSLGILCKTEEQYSGFIMKELLFKASNLGTQNLVRFLKAERIDCQNSPSDHLPAFLVFGAAFLFDAIFFFTALRFLDDVSVLAFIGFFPFFLLIHTKISRNI